MPRILLTGGLGYIGSHTGFELLDAGYEITIVDNCSNSSEAMLDQFKKYRGTTPQFFCGDIRDKNFLESVFSHAPIDAVIHFAALKAVDESFEKRDEYFDVNVVGTRTLCDVMEQFGVRRLVYSSSATVYGVPESNPISENAQLSATNPYGETKLACEKLLADVVARLPDWSVVILRYFNPAGAHQSGLLGERPKKAANLAAAILEVLRGERNEVVINGVDYPTADGTCIRDFIHVVDVARAHVVALAALDESLSGLHVFNIGTGHGYSVKEMIAAFEAAAHRTIPIRVGARRDGDVVVAIADPTKIERELGWHAEHTLQDIAESAVKGAYYGM